MLSHSFLHKLCSRKIQRIISISVRNHNFDGESYSYSKTSLSMITKEDQTNNYIEAYSAYGFRLTSGFRVLGPCAVFPRAVLHWNVPSADRITPESLSLFSILYPKLDILILGKGDWDAKIDKNIIKYLRSNKINVEILPTEQACSTFNFLNSEGRVVAAGLIPPMQLDRPSSDNIFLHDEEMGELPNEPMPDEHPEVTKTMESFQKHGIIDTVTEGERSRRARSRGPFADTEEQGESSNRDGSGKGNSKDG